MNDSFDEIHNSHGGYMSLGIQEKSQLIFKDIKNSYIFWQVKKAIREEVVKSKGRPSEVADMIPKLMSDLNLETKIKNKVHEVLDKNGYFKDSSQIAKTKFKACSDMSLIPN